MRMKLVLEVCLLLVLVGVASTWPKRVSGANKIEIRELSGRATQVERLNATRKTLAQVSQQWAKLWMAKDLEAVMELYAPDAVFLTGSGDRFTGQTAIRDLFSKALETNTSRITVRSIKTEISNDLAYDSGDYQETIGAVSGGDKKELEGNYIIVFKRNKDGRWLIVEHIWTFKLKTKGS